MKICPEAGKERRRADLPRGHARGQAPPESYNLSRMIAKRFEALFADPHGAPAMIRRLLMEHAYRHRYSYVWSPSP